MRVLRGKEPSAAERANSKPDTCIACTRVESARVVLEVRDVPGAGPVGLCIDEKNCRLHAQKVGIYCAV